MSLLETLEMLQATNWISQYFDLINQNGIGFCHNHELDDIMDRLIKESKTHIPNSNCKKFECELCSVRDCPFNDPYHYHKKGCLLCESCRN